MAARSPLIPFSSHHCFPCFRWRSGCRRGFTLIELLVVIAVLAILVGLLLPVINRSIEQGRTAECMGHVKAITGAFLAYAGDHNGRYPATGKYNWGGGGWDSDKFWINALPDMGYLDVERTGERQGVFWCPAEDNHHGMADYGPSDNVIPHSSREPSVVEVLEPSKTILFGEARRAMGDDEYGGSWWLKSQQWIANAEPGGSGAPLPARHRGHMHMGFCDGHVESIHEDRLVEEREQLFTGPYDSTNPDY